MNLQPLQEFLDWFSETQRTALAQNKITLTCSRGCSACCSEPLVASEPEVLLMLSRLNAEQIAAVKKRTEEWLVKAKASGVDWNGADTDAFAYRRLNMACPFLENNQCMAYASRPYGCRWFAALGPRINCEDLALRPKQKFMESPELMKMASVKMMNAFCDTLGEGQSIGMSHLGILLANHFGLINAEVVEV